MGSKTERRAKKAIRAATDAAFEEFQKMMAKNWADKGLINPNEPMEKPKPRHRSEHKRKNNNE